MKTLGWDALWHPTTSRAAGGMPERIQPYGQGGARPDRLLYIDNLRWSAISMVVVIHAAVTYSHYGSWYFYDHANTSRAAVICLATYQSFQHAVAMGLLFGIAGLFAGSALQRRGATRFLNERAFRLGLPLLLYVLVIGPATQHFVVGSPRPHASFAGDWWRYVTNGAVFSGSGPLWFCLVLLVFCAGFALVDRVLPWQVRLRAPTARTALAFALVMAGLTFLVGLVAPADRVVLNVSLHDFAQYPMMFAAGVMAQRNGWLPQISSRAGRTWAVGGLVAAAAAWFVIITQGGALTGHLALYGGGWYWQAAAMDLWRSCTCVCLTLGLLTLYRDHFNTQGPVARFLTRNAFGVYVFHPPILIATTRALHDWPVDLSIKFAVACIVAVAATFLFVGFVARRMPGVRAII